MEGEDKFDAWRLREREKCRNESAKQRATRLQATDMACQPSEHESGLRD